MNANYTFYAARNRNGGTELVFLGGNSLCPASSPVPPYYQAEPRKRISAFDETHFSLALFLFSSKNSGQSPGAKLGFSAARDTLAHVSRVNYRAPGRGSIKYRFLGGAHAASTNRVSCSHLMSCIRMPRAHVQRAAERVHVRRCIQRRHVGGAP